MESACVRAGRPSRRTPGPRCRRRRRRNDGLNLTSPRGRQNLTNITTFALRFAIAGSVGVFHHSIPPLRTIMSRQRPWDGGRGGHLNTISATFIHPSSRAYRLQARVHLFIVALSLSLRLTFHAWNASFGAETTHTRRNLRRAIDSRPFGHRWLYLSSCPVVSLPPVCASAHSPLTDSEWAGPSCSVRVARRPRPIRPFRCP